jgi:hypothetical protein
MPIADTPYLLSSRLSLSVLETLQFCAVTLADYHRRSGISPCPEDKLYFIVQTDYNIGDLLFQDYFL